MFILILLGIVTCAAAGGAIKITTDKFAPQHGSITGRELLAGTLACALLVCPLIIGVGYSMMRASAVTYTEYWNGLEDKAWVDTTTCTKDGSCRHTYDCDSYTVTVTKTRQVPYTTTETYTTSNGGLGTRTVTKHRTESYTEPETRWHSCPYTTHEYTYQVSDTLGETHTMGEHWFPENPSTHRWTGFGYNDARFAFGTPGLPTVPTGQPERWIEVKDRLDAGTPGGVTKTHAYKNYILASQDDIYAKSSAAIDGYRKDGMLPMPAQDTYDYYRADKAYLVNNPVTDAEAWQDAVLRFNGHLGNDRQGDLHLVLVKGVTDTSADTYTNALAAYWQSEDLGKKAIAKNALVVVVGTTDGTIIDWARGVTTMPVGNERLAVAIREELTNTPLTPEALLGTPQDGIDGSLGVVVFGEDTGFIRTEMADYDYLFSEIKPTGPQQTLLVGLALLVSLGFWALAYMHDLIPVGRPTRSEPRFGRDLSNITTRERLDLLRERQRTSRR